MHGRPRNARDGCELAEGQVGPQRDAREEHAVDERTCMRTTAASSGGQAAQELGELCPGKARQDEPRSDHHGIVNVRTAA